MKKKLSLLFFFLKILAVSWAQQLPFYSNYNYKPFFYNPSFAGDKNCTEIFAIHHSQFTGFSNAPVLNALSLDTKLKEKKAFIGLLIANQQKGLFSNSNALLSYAYQVNLNENVYLKLGLSAGVFSQGFNFSKMMVENNSDPELYTSFQRKNSLDGNAGMSLYLKKIIVGFSVPQLFASKLNYNSSPSVRTYYGMTRHFAASLKYEYTLNKALNVAPNVLVRMANHTPMQYDAGILVQYYKKIWAGIVYKSDYALGINLGATISNKISVGYNYDFLIGKISKYAGLSHEIMIAYRIGTSHSNMAEQKQEDLSEIEQEEQEKTPVVNEKNNADENKKNKAIFRGKNVTKENGYFILTNKSSDFARLDNNTNLIGFYIVVESCFYREYAISEAKKYAKMGYSNCNILLDKSANFYYVYIDYTGGKEDALKKIETAKTNEIKDAWLQQLVN